VNADIDDLSKMTIVVGEQPYNATDDAAAGQDVCWKSERGIA
jgi:hypothetical protein